MPDRSHTAPPTRDDVLAYMGTGYRDPGTTLDDALAAAVIAQRARCVTDPYGPDLFTAALRRTAAILAASNAPLGVADMGEFGSVNLPRWDAITEALEAPYLLPRFA
jgi:hypothetical protein